MSGKSTAAVSAAKSSLNVDRSGLLQRKCDCGNAAGLTGKCSECENKRLTLQRRATSQSEADEVPPIVHEVLNSSGQPLDTETRAFMESRFGHNFSQVRVHTDEKAAQSVQAVNALAYTVGRKVVFGQGQYTPKTEAGNKLLAHELAHVLQQRGESAGIRPEAVEATEHPSEYEAEQAAEAVMAGNSVSIQFKNPSFVRLQRSPISEGLRRRIELCVNPFYYDAKGNYSWMIDPKPDCLDIKIPADRERAWKCLNRMYWSLDGKKWTWPFEAEPKCSDLHLPVSLVDARAKSPEEQARRIEQERLAKIVDANRSRIIVIRDKSPTDVEALARMFTDSKIVDNGTISGRVHAILDATQHSVIPGLHTGIEFGQSGFRQEFYDPWPSSINQVGHFLTAVRLAFDPEFLNSIILTAILGSWSDTDVPLRLIIGHEKEPDPDIFNMSVGFKAQYRVTTEEDIKNFKAGNLSAIKVGKGRGNSMADLLLSEKGWILGRWIAKGHFKSKQEIADWIRGTIGTLKQ
jgi:hypothetical protein